MRFNVYFGSDYYSCLLLLAVAGRALAVQEINTDVCVYGGTSGGVVAAVQAARMGKSVALVVVNNHLGGMSSGGLGSTDIGSYGDSYIQGTAREFYTRVGQKYGTGAAFAFEPHVAEAVFNEMAQQAGMIIYTNQYLVSVSKRGQQIMAATMNNGNVFRAKIFIDASYEGDLMAKAGVSYTVGREAASQYNENLNGIRTPNTGGHQFGSANVSPYLASGNSNSGLLPWVQSAAPGAAGAADQRVQAYNFRMCLTTVVSNQLAITAPANYSAAHYELLARYIQAQVAQGASLTLGSLMIISAMPNGKTDINNYGAVSTDFIGQNYNYPEADYAARQQIWQAHKDYIQGLFYFLATDPRIPAAVQSQMNSYALCKDEFADNGGWPYQLYVREARRMVSDYVLTQSNCLGQAIVPDSIGLAAHTMDSHNCQRCVVNNYAQNEGDVEVAVPNLYSMPYRVMVPKSTECNNLVVPWCISASHIGFSSFRMEPVFMIVSQAAGTAACLAIDDGVTVQNVNMAKLQAQLLADQQSLGTLANGNTANGNPAVAIIIDDADGAGVQIVGSWISSTAISGYYGSDYLQDGNTNKGSSSVTYIPTLPQSGSYGVYVRWTAYSNRANNAPIDVVYPGGTNTFLVDQTQQGGQWVLLMTTNFNAGTNGYVRIRNNGTTGYVIADAVAFATNGVLLLPSVNIWAGNAQASRLGLTSGSMMVSRDGSNAPLTVYLANGGTALNGSDYVLLPGSVTLPAGVLSTNISITPYSNAQPVGDKTVVISVATNTAYSLGSLSLATVFISDTPINDWRVQFFGANATNSNIAGDFAAPAGDGIPNLMKYALGLNPTNAINTPLIVTAFNANGYFTLSYTRPDPQPVDVNYAVNTSSNLLTWLTNSSSVSVSAIAFNTNFTSATVTIQEQPPARNQSFFRLSVSRN